MDKLVWIVPLVLVESAPTCFRRMALLRAWWWRCVDRHVRRHFFVPPSRRRRGRAIRISGLPKKSLKIAHRSIANLASKA
jgi:hypothetical protein